MKTKLFFIIIIVVFSNLAFSQDNIQSTAQAVVQEIFRAAKLMDFSKVGNLCDPSGRGDGDTRKICSLQDGSKQLQKDFSDYFKNGKITGKPIIDGNIAKVNFLFGPKGNIKETMNLVKVDGLWYLSSF